jgi:hypothetical protein
MERRFELWAVPSLGELYAVRRDAGEVSGICGPIPLAALAALNLRECDYEAMPPDTEWRRTQPREFVPAADWVLGFEHRALVFEALARAAGRPDGLPEQDRAPRRRRPAALSERSTL